MDFSFFKRGSSTRRIKDLSAAEIAVETTANFKRTGWSLLTGRLLYRGIELDPTHVPLLIGLSEYFNDEPPDRVPQANGLLSGLILSHAFSMKNRLDPDELRMLEAARLKLLSKWGLVQHSEGDSSELNIDDIAFVRILGQMKSMGFGETIEAGFGMAHVRLGLRCGALIPKKAGRIDTTYAPRFYRLSRAYTSWLSQDSGALARTN